MEKTDTERRFHETLQTVFGSRCGEFSETLRGKLRDFYHAARSEGVALKGGQEIESFQRLESGMVLQNDHLNSIGHARVILGVEYSSVLIKLETGDAVGRPETFTVGTFNQYSPYWVVKDPLQRNSTT